MKKGLFVRLFIYFFYSKCEKVTPRTVVMVLKNVRGKKQVFLQHQLLCGWHIVFYSFHNKMIPFSDIWSCYNHKWWRSPGLNFERPQIWKNIKERRADDKNEQKHSTCNQAKKDGLFCSYGLIGLCSVTQYRLNQYCINSFEYWKYWQKHNVISLILGAHNPWLWFWHVNRFWLVVTVHHAKCPCILVFILNDSWPL